jgi:hypothetical protein
LKELKSIARSSKANSWGISQAVSDLLTTWPTAVADIVAKTMSKQNDQRAKFRTMRNDLLRKNKMRSRRMQ